MKESVGKNRKNIWIDICHTPQFNFYKNFIIHLAKKGHVVYVTVLDRGKMPIIVQKELESFPTIKVEVIGKHKLTKTSAIIDANMIRLIKLLYWSFNKRIDITYSNAFFSSLIGRIKGFKAYTFDDDFRLFSYWPKLWFSTKSHYCIYEIPLGFKVSPKLEILPVLKEWAYLAPSAFSPSIEELEKYNLTAKGYFFVREVSVGTINYASQKAGTVQEIMALIPKNKKVLLSLEDKSSRSLYPKEWILLEEPIESIYSLIYYSCGLISSGDSMAREAAMLGIPSYYLGIRYSMPANAAAAKLGNLHNSQTQSFGKWIKRFENDITSIEEDQVITRNKINQLFIDINSYMYSLLNYM